MGLWTALASALRVARESKAGRLSASHGLALAAGALLTWLAARRSGVPPVRATGVAENAVKAQDIPPRP